MLRDVRVVLGVTGGIAAYKSAQLVSTLKKQGADVRVVMTRNACRFVAPLTFETLSGNRVHTDSFEYAYEIEHISLAKWAQALVIAPATANILAKMAGGIADDLLSTTCLALTCPVLIAPAMNSAMWRHPATQQNMQTLRARGVQAVGPASGRLACGDEDVGRMSEPDQIAAALDAMLCPRRDLEGRRVLVTAGPTREALDPVRFLTNRSSGRMGYAIAEAARDRGAQVTLVSGPVEIAPPAGVELAPVQTTLELYDEMLRRASESDAVIQAAAPADYRPVEFSEQKIKKTGGEMTLRFAPNPDVAAELGRRKKEGQVLVVFAAETGAHLDNAREKLLRKNADLMAFNDVTQPGAGFGVSTNQVTLIAREGPEETLPLLSKRETADRILDRVAALLC